MRKLIGFLLMVSAMMAHAPRPPAARPGFEIHPDHVAATNKKLKLFRTYCGTEDTLFEANKGFHALLDQRGITHTFTQSGGAHVCANWRDYLTDLAPRLFR